VEPAVAILDTPLSVEAVLSAVRHPGAGGIALFLGAVRDYDGPGGEERAVQALEYSAHPLAMAELERVVRTVEQDFPECRVAAHHRTGPLEIGDLAVVVAAAAPHRAEAFAAARRLIDDLKSQVPIWKHQSFIDGSEEWVGLP
jgi:molybdopterin synthase catalytic subunit